MTQFRSVFPYHNQLNESGIGLNPCRIHTSTPAAQLDRAIIWKIQMHITLLCVIMVVIQLVTANYGADSGVVLD